MQTRSGKIYSIQGKYHVASGDLLDAKISKTLLEIQHLRSAMEKIPKILKLYAIVNDNFEDKMALWNGGKQYYYCGLNRILFDKSIEFERKIQELIAKKNTDTKKQVWSNAIKQLHLYQTNYAKHQQDVLEQIQDWIGGSGDSGGAFETLPPVVPLGVVPLGVVPLGVVPPVVPLGVVPPVVPLGQRLDLNIASHILSYLY